MTPAALGALLFAVSWLAMHIGALMTEEFRAAGAVSALTGAAGFGLMVWGLA